jgi:subtilase family serine protease
MIRRHDSIRRGPSTLIEMPRTIRPLIFAVACALAALIPAAASAATAHPATSRTAESATARAELRLVLPLAADTAALSRYSSAVSTPGNALYHHYESIAWLARHFGVSPASAARAVAYLKAHGASDVKLDATGLFIDATLRTATAERLFGTALVVHADRAGAYTTPRNSATIPAALKGVVTGVVGLDTQSVVASPAVQHVPASVLSRNPFSSISASSITSSATEPTGTSGYLKSGAPPFTSSDGTQSGCLAGQSTGGFTPNQYLDAYDYNTVQGAGVEGQGERVALIEVDGFRRSNINAFDSCFGLPQPHIQVFRTSRAVSNSGLPAGGEATLDLEVLSAAAPGLKQVDVYESTQDISSVLESLTAPLENPGYKPQVISASLGLCEAQVREAVGLAGIRDTEAALEDASDSGISVLAASGDDGSSDCTDADSETALPVPVLAANFPASSPYVTAVGGTNFVLNSANQITYQEVWNDGAQAPGSAGGGGFSSVFPRPGYQLSVNTTRYRALPDVSGLADIAPGYDIYCTASPDCINVENSDPWQPVGGTSASTPLLAGGLALIDQELREHRQQSLGLVNPLLYALGENTADAPQVFDDVTQGSNDVGPFIRASHEPVGGYSAGVGFDEASGWGSVNLAGLSEFALEATPAIVNVTQLVPSNTGAAVAGYIADRVNCSGKCQIGAYARITIGLGKPLIQYSGLYSLPRAGFKLVKIPIQGVELAKVRAAYRTHRRVTAAVVGAIVDAGGNIESQTPARQVVLSP